jgi:hypothetical protein
MAYVNFRLLSVELKELKMLIPRQQPQSDFFLFPPLIGP